MSDVDRFQRVDVGNRPVEGDDPAAVEGNGIDGNSSLATSVWLKSVFVLTFCINI